MTARFRGLLHGTAVTSPWELTRLPAVRSDDPVHGGIDVVDDPARVARATAELRRGPARTLGDGTRFSMARTREGVAGWFDGVGTFIVDSTRSSVIASPPSAERALWEHRLIGWAVPALLGDLGATVFHASVLAGSCGSWLLCGASGRGKTTTSLLMHRAGWSVLSDDMAVVRHGAAGPQVAVGPTGCRVLQPDGSKAVEGLDRAAPVSAPPLAGGAVLAARGPDLAIEVLPQQIGFLALCEHLMSTTSSAHHRMVRRTAMLARALPIARISMPDDINALPAAVGDVIAQLPLA